jgi:hypothetical protein
MADRTILRINSVSLGVLAANTATNVLGVREEHVHQVVPRMVPNTHGGRTVNQDHKWYEITVILDSDTDIFDGDWSILADNVSINDFWVAFELTPSVAVIGTPAAYASCNINIAAQTFTAAGGDPYWIFEPGDEIVVSNAEDAANDGTYVINTVTPTVITTVGAPGANNALDTEIRIARGTTETWTYAETFLTDRREGRIDTDQERDTVEYEFISINAKTIHITDGAYAP